VKRTESKNACGGWNRGGRVGKAPAVNAMPVVGKNGGGGVDHHRSTVRWEILGREPSAQVRTKRREGGSNETDQTVKKVPLKGLSQDIAKQNNKFGKGRANQKLKRAKRF